MPVFNQYFYEPLSSPESIRVIHLDPAQSRDAPLSCLLVERRRRRKTADYSAVSYAWGKREFTFTLEIRCGRDTSYLRIGPNVDALLRALRAPDVPVCLWIDAICIHQDDDTEKAQQIPLMGRIFGEAEHVHIWLGAEDHATASVFAFFREASQIEITPTETQWDFAGKVASVMRKCVGDDGMNGMGHLSKFFERPWFLRRWVIQEAGLARQAVVHCGSHSIPLGPMITAAQSIQSLDLSWYEVAMVAKLRSLGTGMDILQLLWYFHGAACFDPRDRVAALLGLAPEVLSCFDYNVLWPDLYRQLATFCLEFGCQNSRLQLMLQLLEFGPVPCPAQTSFPSWVPDWSKTRLRTLPYHSRIRNPDTFERMPPSPGYSEKSVLTLQNGCLRISWDASVCGPRGRPVTLASKFDSPPSSRQERAEGVVNLLNELLPSLSEPFIDLLTICSLMEMIIEFRHHTLHHRLDMDFFSMYAERIVQMFPKAVGTTYFSGLWGLDGLLREFSLLKLEPFDSESKATRAYGIGPRDVGSDDIMVPLWRLNWEPGRYCQVLEDEGAVVHLVTMLAVRSTKHLPPRATQGEDIHAQNGEILPLKGKIIGPAVCVMVGSVKGHTDDGSHKGRRGKPTDDEEYCIMLD